MTTAFYLLKPDALDLGAPSERAREMVSHLDAVASHDLVLTSRDVAALWAGHRSDLHPIATTFLELYLVGRTSRLVIVAGADALPSVMRMKHQLRAEFGRGAFANVVHAPSSAAENQQHQAILTRTADVAVEVPVDTSTRNRPAAESVLGLPPGIVFDAVADVWHRAQRDGWAALAQARGDGSTEVWVVTDDVQSIDSAVSGLWGALPDIDLSTAIAIICEAERCGRALAFTGPYVAARRAADRIKAHGLLAEVVATAR